MVLDVGRHGGAVDMELVGAGKAADLLLMTASLCARSVWNIKSSGVLQYCTPSGVFSSPRWLDAFSVRHSPTLLLPKRHPHSDQQDRHAHEQPRL